MNEQFKPGQTCEQSGIYDILNNSGKKTTQLRTVVEGEPFPPTPKGKQTYQLSIPSEQDVEDYTHNENEDPNASRYSRRWLFLAIVIFIFIELLYVIGALLTITFYGYEDVTQILPGILKDFNIDVADGFAIGIFIALAFFFLVTLPISMVTSYRGVQYRMLKLKIKEDLWLCGLESKQLDSKMKEFRDKNSFEAFTWPAVVNLFILFVVWGIVFMPHGYSGINRSLMKDVTPENISNFYFPDITVYFIGYYFKYMARFATPVTWAFLGAYFYMLMVLIRRWLQSDLTSGVLWKLNVRMVVSLIIGLLLMRIDYRYFNIGNVTFPANSTIPTNSAIPAILAFTAGIVPDSVLRWLSQKFKNLVSLEWEGLSEVFKPSEMQNKIDGLNFWQADRLFEEGIESVQDLATKEIPNLLINTRFDTPQVLYWVDQALLCMQVDKQVDKFKNVFILTATDLVDLEKTKGVNDISKTMKDVNRETEAELLSENGKVQSDTKITSSMIANAVIAIKSGPNLPYIKSYWENTHTPEAREERLEKLPMSG